MNEILEAKKILLEAVYQSEANLSRADIGTFESAKSYSVSGLDSRVDARMMALDDDKLRECLVTLMAQRGIAVSISGGDETILAALGRLTEGETIYSAIEVMMKIDKELVRIVLENRAKAAAWSLGERTKIPFIMCEGESFRPSLKFADVKNVESRVVPGGVNIFVPESREPDTQDMQMISALAESAVISSFMLHDVEIAEEIASGNKANAAAKSIAYATLAEKIVSESAGEADNGLSDFVSEVMGDAVENFSFATNEAQASQAVDFPVVMNKHISGLSNGLLIDALITLKDVANAEAAAKGDIDDGRKGELSGGAFEVRGVKLQPKKEGEPEAFWADIVKGLGGERNHFRQAIKNIASLIEVSEQIRKLRKKDEQPGQGEGEGSGEGQGLADVILSMFHSNADAGPGDAQQQGQGQQAGEDQSTEERIAKLGRFGSTQEGARLNELLAGVDWHTACIAESPVDWTDYLNGALLRATGIDRTYTWSRPSRRHASMGIYVPGFKRRRCKRIALCIDESGSIDMPKLEKFNEEIIRVIDTVNPEGVDVIHFSTQVAEETLIQGEAWEAKRLLNGGTRFQVAFQAIANHMADGQQYDAIVFFTDMEDSGYWGLSRSNVESVLPEMPEMFWVAYGGNSRMPDFGTYIDMDTGKLGEFN